jgi:hypothetical protein
MEGDARPGELGALEALLAGLQSGMLGALTMLGWLAAASVYYRRSLWTVPNLLASTFHGEAALRSDFTRTTFSGIALHLMIYATLGAVFGLLVGHRTTRLRIALLGVIYAMGWYYLSFGALWKSVNPLVPLYVPDRPMIVGHLIYGGLLGRVPVYLRGLRSRL